MSQLPSSNDDTALYRISGWALKSTIEHVTKLIRNDITKEDAQDQLDLLLSLKRHEDEKEFLPSGARYLDRGGIDIHAVITSTLAICCRREHACLP